MKNFLALVRGKLFTLNCRFFRKNIHVGDGLRIYKKLSLKGEGSVYIGKNCIVDGINGDRTQYVTIDTHSPDAVIRIGDNASLCAARISAKFEIMAGDDWLIEESGIMDTDFHSIDRSRGKPIDENRDKCRIVIGNRVCIGAKSLVMKGVTIGDNALIVPGSIVTMSIRPNSIAGGNPAKILHAL